MNPPYRTIRKVFDLRHNLEKGQLMPPTPLDFHRAIALAFKDTLEKAPTKQKEGRVSIQIAQQFNSIVEQIKQAFPGAATHLPQPIFWNEMFAAGPVAGVSFLELEMMLNQVLAVLEVLRADR